MGPSTLSVKQYILYCNSSGIDDQKVPPSDWFLGEASWVISEEISAL